MDFEKICTVSSFLAAFRPEEFMLNILVIPFFNGGFSDVDSRVSVLPGSETVQSTFPRGSLLLHTHRLSEYTCIFFSLFPFTLLSSAILPFTH